MTDRAEQIIAVIEACAATIGAPVERDRVLPVQKTQAPLVVVRTGTEELDPPEGARLLQVSLRWTMEVSVEHYVDEANPNLNRAALNAAWAAFRNAFFASEIIRGDLLANGTQPGLARSLQSPSSNPNIGGQVFSLVLTFTRT